MKQFTKNKKIILVGIAVVILAGIIVTAILGFNFDLKYQASKKVEIYIQKNFEVLDIKNIINEVMPNEAVQIQIVEVYEDMVRIISKDITEEQKENIITKINEKYETEIANEDVVITTIPHTRGRDIIKPYIMPFVIATVIILVYMGIRFRKLGIASIVLKEIGIQVLAQMLLFSVIAITRIPVGRLTIPMVLAVYVITLIATTASFEKTLGIKKQKENKKK